MAAALEKFGASFAERMFGSAVEDTAARVVEKESVVAAERAATDTAERMAARNVGAAENIGSAGSKSGGWRWDSKKVGMAVGGTGVAAYAVAPHMVGDVLHEVSKDVSGLFGSVVGEIGGGMCEGVGMPPFFCKHALTIMLVGGAIVVLAPLIR